MVIATSVIVAILFGEAARHAFRHFGKGGRPAALNFGDCFSYALSKTTGEPLLFNGNDLGGTDVAPVPRV